MNIGELSKKVGLSAKTIRYYEEVGLISNTLRKENGYRDYHEANIDELRIIKYTRELGLPIQKIKKLMTGCKDGNCHHSKEYLLDEIDDSLRILKQKEREMFELNKRLNLLKKHIVKGEDKNSKYCCNILGQLTEMDKGGDIK